MDAMEKFEANMRVLGPSIGDDLRRVPESGVEELKRLVGWDDGEDFSKTHSDSPMKRALKGFLRAHQGAISAVREAQRGPAINPAHAGA